MSGSSTGARQKWRCCTCHSSVLVPRSENKPEVSTPRTQDLVRCPSAWGVDRLRALHPEIDEPDVDPRWGSEGRAVEWPGDWTLISVDLPDLPIVGTLLAADGSPLHTVLARPLFPFGFNPT